MYAGGIMAFHEKRAEPMPSKSFCSSSFATREKTGIRDLVPVKVQDRQEAAVPRGVQELVAVPAGCERSGFGFPVAHHAGDDQFRIVEGGP